MRYDADCPKCGPIVVVCAMSERKKMVCPECGSRASVAFRATPHVNIPRRFLNGALKEEIY